MNLLPDAVGLLKLIKKTAVEAVEAAKPVNLCFGTVESVSPLKIKVEQKMTLGSAQLTLSRNVTDYKVKIEMDSAEQEITVKNGLAAGETVILARQQGGQKYFVLDRGAL